MASEARSDLTNGFVLANFTYLPNISSSGHPKGLLLGFREKIKKKKGEEENLWLLDLRLESRR